MSCRFSCCSLPSLLAVAGVKHLSPATASISAAATSTPTTAKAAVIPTSVAGATTAAAKVAFSEGYDTTEAGAIAGLSSKLAFRIG